MAAPSSSTVAFVRFPRPAALPPDAIADEFAALVPQFEAVPGLLRKYFLLSDDGASVGGCYLWTDRETAEAFYTDLRPHIRAAYGADPEITFFTVPAIAEGTGSRSARIYATSRSKTAISPN